VFTPAPESLREASFVERPERSGPAGFRGRSNRLETPDYGALERENRRLGRLGEGMVVEAEIDRLRAAGRPDLAERVVWVARDLGDGAGYDVASFELDGTDRHIEIKTTKLGPGPPFYLSAWELAFADEHPDTACIYRVYDAEDQPRIFIVRPPYGKELPLEPITYRVWP
jgi:hypothetical protein